MQKFKATREEIMKAYKTIVYYDNTNWVLEGELLEDGTVEKCCKHVLPVDLCGCPCHRVEKCIMCPHDLCVPHRDVIQCDCPCHNKKEEKCICGFAKSKHSDKTDFNRETSKVPERLTYDFDTLAQVEKLTQVMNIVLDYLKAHE